MTIWDCRTRVRMTSMTSSVERTDLDFKISVALSYMSTIHSDADMKRQSKIYKCLTGS